MLVVAIHCRVPGFAGGFLGVDMFFVLSGYLITRLLKNEHETTGRIALARFWVRRLVRLWPPLLALLAVSIVIGPLLLPTLDHVRAALISGLYMTDYIGAYNAAPWRGPVTHTWSLAIEEKYYLIWPPVLIALLCIDTRLRLLGAVLALFVLATAWRVVEVVQLQDFFAVYSRLDTRFSGFLLGGLLALAGTIRMTPRMADALAIASWALLVAALASYRLTQLEALVWGIVLVEIATIGLILAVTAAQGVAYRVLGSPVLASVGMISYAIYLWHYPLALLLRDALPWPATFAIVTVGSLALARTSWLLIERPLLGLRQRLRAPGQALARPPALA